ncbi:hypothetical protein GCM10022405_21380 [Gibbsiella dentisursi]|uniref:Integrase DNA-binding domain-containing protein n=1 Tax=Gibbsiella dentisursi TaxID=796890 RepID=A0ABP7L8I6_9GAMM
MVVYRLAYMKKNGNRLFRCLDFVIHYTLVNTRGSRLWYLKYRIDGKELGAYPDVSLADARQ